MRAKVIAVVSQRAAVGKTTLVHNLGVCLAMRQKRVLMVDLDSQAVLSSMCGLFPEEYDGKNIVALLGQAKITYHWNGKAIMKPLHKDFGAVATDCIHPVGVAPGVSDYLRLIPSMIDLDDVESEMQAAGILKNQNLFLKRALMPLSDEFDYILLDCPPRRSLLTTNALMFADKVLIPTKMDPVSYAALEPTVQLIKVIQEDGNPDLHDPDIVANVYQSRVPLERKNYEKVCADYHVICTLPIAAIANRGVYDGVSAVEYWPEHEFSVKLREFAETIDSKLT